MYSRNEITSGRVHEICDNKELKVQNKAKDNVFICIGPKCGKYKEKLTTAKSK